MDRKALAEHWEHQLGDPNLPQSALNLHTVLELDEHERFPQSSIDALQALGAFEMLIPARDGGQLQEPEQLLMLGRLLSRRDLSSAIAFGQTMLGSLPLWLAGTTAQKQRLIEDLRAGALGCLALTEKAHGSDILSNEVSGVATADGFLIDGEKWLINNAGQGGSATVLGRLQRPGRAAEIVLWHLRKRGQPQSGWRALPKIRTLGIRGADISGFALSGYRADADALLRGSEPAIYTVLKTLQISRILCSGFALGAVDTQFRLALRFARQRQLYGKPVLAIPMVRARLAHCTARLLVADLMAQLASRAIAALPQELSLLSAIAKFHVPTEAEALGRELGVVLGARHYLRSELPWSLFQKMQRDGQVVSLFDGSTQVNLSLIAAQLRQLGEQLAQVSRSLPAEQQPAGAPTPLAALFMPEQACRGWPEAAELKLSNGGMDSIASAFLRLGSVSGPCAAAVNALRARWQAWLMDCEQATQVQRLAHDSVKLMQLAERYIALHSGAVAVLGWLFTRSRVGQQACISDAVLISYIASRWPEAGIEVTDQQYAEIIAMAERLLDQQRLISLQEVQLAGSL